MSDTTAGQPTPDRERLFGYIHGDEHIKALALALIGSFSPSRSLSVDEILDESFRKILESKGKMPNWDDPAAVRPFVHCVIKNILRDWLRKRREAKLGDGDEDVADPNPDDWALHADLLAAFVELDRTKDPALVNYFATYRLYNFLSDQDRFSKEGDALLSSFEGRVRTLEEVGKMRGISSKSAHYHVNQIKRWLKERLREYGNEDSGRSDPA